MLFSKLIGYEIDFFAQVEIDEWRAIERMVTDPE